MASPESPDPREWRQMRNDVDDGYKLLKRVQESIIKVSATQRQHGDRLDGIHQTLDIHSGRLDRMEDNQRRQGERLGRVETRLDVVDTRLDGIDSRLDGIDGRLDGVDGRLDVIDGRLGRMEKTQEQILDILRGRPPG